MTMPDIQLYQVHQKKSQNIARQTLPANPSIYIYINRINNRLVLKINDWQKLELQTLESIKLFDGTKHLIDKTKNVENVPSLEVAKVVLVQCNLVENQYQQKSEALHTFLYIC